MAGRALPRKKSQPPALAELNRDEVREMAAKLYGQGVPRSKIARMMVDFLVPNRKERPLEQRLSQARTKLRQWELQDSFRDLVYRMAVVKLDLQAPAILNGVAQKAKRGRVDAARLALEITGRHTKTGEPPPTQVQLVVTGVPRPRISATAKRPDGEVETVEVTAEELEADDEV